MFVPVESGGSSSVGDSGSEEEEAETGDVSKLQEMEMAMGTGVSPDAISKAKQTRSEKKARKCMLKLGLKNVPGMLESCCCCFFLFLSSFLKVKKTMLY